MEAGVTKLARVSARFSKSLARRRFRPNQQKVRSTTQRRGMTTKPLMSSLDDLHAQQRHLCRRSVNSPGIVAAIGPYQFEPGEMPAYLVEDEHGPIAVLDRGGVDDDPHRSPSLSTRAWILRPVTRLPTSYPTSVVSRK